MTLPQGISDRIGAEALQYAKLIPDCMPHIAYRRGATEWAGKCKELADALVILNAAIDKTWNECNTQSIPDKYKKEIAAAQAQCGAELAKYKEVEK